MQNPYVSIIIPCYNQAHYLDECLQSVSDQTYPCWECIIVNDGSTDNSLKLARKWQKKDSRFSIIVKQNEGVTKTRNTGLNKASGEWILFLDGDDVIAKNKLEESLKFSEKSNFIVTDFTMLETDYSTSPPFCNLGNKEINFKNVLTGWDVGFNIPIHCILFSKKILGDTQFTMHLKAKEDWIFWLEILNKPEVITHFLSLPLVSYRSNPNGASKKTDSVNQDMLEANLYLYNLYGQEVKNLLFEKVCLMNFDLTNTVTKQKSYINKLQNTKVLKYYLKLKGLLK